MQAELPGSVGTLQRWRFGETTCLIVITISLLIGFHLVHEGLNSGLLLRLLQPVVYHGEQRNAVSLSLYLLVDGSRQTAENAIEDNKVGYAAAAPRRIPLRYAAGYSSNLKAAGEVLMSSRRGDN